LRGFWDLLGLGQDGRRAALTPATIDMATEHEKALRERIPQVAVVFDCFHVERQAHAHSTR
jgi:hypothetical protein